MLTEELQQTPLQHDAFQGRRHQYLLQHAITCLPVVNAN